MNYAILLSGGVGTRMRSDGFPKQYIEIDGKPIILYALEPFAACQSIDHIVIVASEQWKPQIQQWLQDYQITKSVTFAESGNTRQESILNGLSACAAIRQPADADKVIIHEAVRPLVSLRIIQDCLLALDQYDCCMPAIPISDSTFLSEDRVCVSQLIDRDRLCCGQSPEAFRFKPYWEVHQACSTEELRSMRASCELPFIKGYTVGLVEGDRSNFKITHPSDLTLFKAYLYAKTLPQELA